MYVTPFPSFMSSQLLTRSKTQTGGQIQNITKHSTICERGSDLHKPGVSEENYTLLFFLPYFFIFFFLKPLQKRKRKGRREREEQQRIKMANKRRNI